MEKITKISHLLKLVMNVKNQKLDKIEIPTNYILSLEDDIPEEYYTKNWFTHI